MKVLPRFPEKVFFASDLFFDQRVVNVVNVVADIDVEMVASVFMVAEKPSLAQSIALILSCKYFYWKNAPINEMSTKYILFDLKK